MNLLIVTEHIFVRAKGKVYDNFCYDAYFFRDYLCHFHTIRVAARIKECTEVPENYNLSSGLGIDFLSMGSVRGWRWFMLAGFLSREKLRSAIREADAVVLRVPCALAWMASKIARKTGKPYLIEVISDPEEAYSAAGRGRIYQLLGLWAKWRLRSIAKGARAASYVNASILPSKYPAKTAKEISVISSIRLPADQILPPRTYNEPLIAPKIVYVGTLTHRKRVGDLIRGCSAARGLGVNASIHIVGSGPEESSLRAISEKEGMTSHVLFHGQLAGFDHICSILDDSDLFVLPSRSEGLPRSIIEAMARGLPVIGSNAQGVRDLVRSQDMFAIGDFVQIGCLISQVCMNTERLNEMSRYSHFIAQKYSQDSLGPMRQRLYSCVASDIEKNN